MKHYSKRSERWWEGMEATEQWRVSRGPASQGRGADWTDELGTSEEGRTQIASYKRPQRVVFAQALPRNASLKVRKDVLRAELAGLRPAGRRLTGRRLKAESYFN
jgi:acyl-CoA synthetase (AMP-forming)/AMP-acid ligase II